MKLLFRNLIALIFLHAAVIGVSAQSNTQSETTFEIGVNRIKELRQEAVAAYNAGDEVQMIASVRKMWAVASQLERAHPEWLLSLLRFNIAAHEAANRDIDDLYRQAFEIAENQLGLFHEKSLELLSSRLQGLILSDKPNAAFEFGQQWIASASKIDRDPATKLPVEILVARLIDDVKLAFRDDRLDDALKLNELAWNLAEDAKYAPALFRFDALTSHISTRLLAKLPVLDLRRIGYQLARDEMGPENELTLRAADELSGRLMIDGFHQEGLIVARVNEEIARRVEGETSFRTNNFRMHMVYNLIALGRRDEANEILEANVAAEEKILRQKLAELPDGEDATSLKDQLASHAEPVEAAVLLRDVVASLQKQGRVHRTPSKQTELALALMALGQIEEARQFVDQALEYYSADSDRFRRDDYYETLIADAKLALLNRPPDVALAKLRNARQMALASYDTWGESAADVAEVGLSRIYKDIGDQDARIDLWREVYLRRPRVATTTLDTLGITSDFGRVYRIASAGNTKLPHNGYDALMRELFIRSQGLSSSTDQAVTLAAARKSAASDPKSRDAFRVWEKAHRDLNAANQGLADLSAMQGQISAQEIEDQRKYWIGQRDTAKRATDTALDRLIQIAPELSEKLAPVPMPIDKLQKSILGPNEALLRFAVAPKGNGAILVWIITSEGIEWAELPFNNGQLQSKTLELRRSLLAGNRGAFSFADEESVVPAFDRKLAHGIYTALFGDPAISNLIQGKQRWTIIPHATLFNMPFNALVMEDPTGRDDDHKALRETRWLGLERTIVVLPSVSAVATTASQPASPQPNKRHHFFGIGDPDFQGTVESNETSLSRATRARAQSGAMPLDMMRTLPRLPGTREEVLALTDLLDSGPEHVLMGGDATEAQLQDASKRGLLQSDIILFATHGLLAGTFEGVADPALVLTPPINQQNNSAEAGYIDDGLLTATEVAGLRLDTELVILSACDTAAGIRNGGEGFSGLASAFLSAGAESLLVSHWPVDDRVAVELTTDTVRAKKQGDVSTYAKALRFAMRRVAMNSSDVRYSHPAYWAPFQIVGAN